MKRSFVFSTVLIIAGLGCGLLWAADFWVAKDYHEWSEKDCNRMLTRSPWAFSNSFRRNANIGSSQTGERETTEILYFRMLTAKPVRMALARLQLLQRPQDEGLKQQVEAYVNGNPGNEIVVQMSYKSIPGASSYLQDLHTFLGSATLAAFRGQTVLVSADGQTVGLTDYLSWGPNRPNPAFVFARTDESGKPYFTGEEKSITLRSDFEVPLSFGSREYRVNVKMKPKDMFFDGKFEF